MQSIVEFQLGNSRNLDHFNHLFSIVTGCNGLELKNHYGILSIFSADIFSVLFCLLKVMTSCDRSFISSCVFSLLVSFFAIILVNFISIFLFARNRSRPAIRLHYHVSYWFVQFTRIFKLLFFFKFMWYFFLFFFFSGPCVGRWGRPVSSDTISDRRVLPLFTFSCDSLRPPRWRHWVIPRNSTELKNLIFHSQIYTCITF